MTDERSTSVTETSATTPSTSTAFSTVPGGKQKGGIGYVLMWMLGVPIPLLILFALLRGCA